MFLAVLKRAAACAPIISIKNVIDDISLHGVGGESTVTQQLVRGYDSVKQDVAALGLPIADRKTGFLANSTALAEALCERWDISMEQRSHSHRDLGGDATSGRCGA